MAESEKTQSFWTTLPGVLTALATLLTAVTGLLVLLYQHGPGAGKANSAAPASMAAESTKTPPASGDPARVQPVQADQKPTVLVIGKDGTATKVFLKGFKNSMTDDALGLKSGQTVPFDKIKSIDFLGVEDYQRDLTVTLTDGRVLEGSIPAGQQFSGQTDIGPFYLSVSNLKQIVFQR